METKILSKMYLVCNKWTSRNAFTILRQLRIVFWCLWWCTRHCLGAQNSKHFMTILGTLECKTNRVKSCISVCIYITLEFGILKFEWQATLNVSQEKNLPTKRLGSGRYIKCGVLHIYFCTYIGTY